MEKNERVETIFARCFRLLSQLRLGVADEFFADLIEGESEKFLRHFIGFLKSRSQTRELVWQVKNLLSLVFIARHLNFGELAASMILEKNLLLLELSLLPIGADAMPTGEGAASEKIGRNLYEMDLNLPQNNVLNLVKERGRVQNREVFERFGNASRRSVKRHLGLLVKAGKLRRTIQGKTVFYDYLEG